MKKFIAFVFCGLMALGLTGCDGPPPPPPPGPPPPHGQQPPPPHWQQPPIDMRSYSTAQNYQGQASGIVIAGSGMTGQTILTDYGESNAQPLVVKNESGKEWIVLLSQPASENLQGKTISVTGVMVDKSNYPAALRSSTAVPDQAIVNAHIVQ